MDWNENLKEALNISEYLSQDQCISYLNNFSETEKARADYFADLLFNKYHNMKTNQELAEFYNKSEKKMLDDVRKAKRAFSRYLKSLGIN